MFSLSCQKSSMTHIRLLAWGTGYLCCYDLLGEMTKRSTSAKIVGGIPLNLQIETHLLLCSCACSAASVCTPYERIVVSYHHTGK